MDWFNYFLYAVYVLWGGLVLTALVIFPIFIAPIILRNKLKLPLHPNLRPLDPDADEVPLPLQRHFCKVAEKLAPDGFRLMGWFLLADQVPGVKAVLAYLEEPKSGEPAQLAALYGQPEPGTWRLKSAYLEFFAAFADGVNVTTSNAAVLGAFGRAEGRTVQAFPGERDPQQLYRLHQALVRRFGSPVAARRQRGGRTVAEFVQDNVVREIERQIGTGYFLRDDEAGVYRLTWKGAVLMAWKMLPPIAAVRWLLVRWRAAALRRRLAADAAAGVIT